MNAARSRTRPRPALAAAALALGSALVAPATAAAQPPAAAAADGALPPLTLGAAARVAAARAAGVEVARANVEQAEARLRQQRSALLPQITGTGAFQDRTFNTATLGLAIPTGTNPVTGQPNPPIFDPRGEIAGPVPVWDVRGRLQASLFDPSLYGRVRAARLAVGATAADTATQGQGAAAQAAAAYVRVLRADALHQARQADSTLAAELLGIAREQLKAGVGVGLDVTRAESQLAAVRAQLIAARNDRDRTRVDLRRALNLPMAAPVTLADALLALPTDAPIPDEGAAIATARARRPELRVLDAQLVAQREAVRATRAEALPSVGVVGDQGWSFKPGGALLPTYNVGVQLSVPLFDGFRREGRVEESRAQLAALEVRRRDLGEQVGADVRGALIDLATATEQVGAARERVRLGEQEVTQARDRFRAGVAGNADVITASLNLSAARAALVEALAAYQGARVALARAEGAVTELP